jgi:hypothetical protein
MTNDAMTKVLAHGHQKNFQYAKPKGKIRHGSILRAARGQFVSIRDNGCSGYQGFPLSPLKCSCGEGDPGGDLDLHGVSCMIGLGSNLADEQMTEVLAHGSVWGMRGKLGLTRANSRNLGLNKQNSGANGKGTSNMQRRTLNIETRES